MDSDIKVERRSAKEEGSCNACQKHTDPDYEIFDVILKTIGFRLCKSCAHDLSVKLAVESIL